MRGVCESILWSEAVVGDARGAVVRAADEAEAVGQQREGGHHVRVVREGARRRHAASVTTSLENCRTLIALRAATLTTLHVGAMRAMWCASVRRTTMCCTTSAGRSVSNFGAIAKKARARFTAAACLTHHSRAS